MKKKLIFVIFSTFALIACNQPSDKLVELNKLKSENKKLTDSIHSLQDLYINGVREYDTAIQLLKNKKYKEAKKIISNFVVKYPKTNLTHKIDSLNKIIGAIKEIYLLRDTPFYNHLYKTLQSLKNNEYDYGIYLLNKAVEEYMQIKSDIINNDDALKIENAIQYLTTAFDRADPSDASFIVYLVLTKEKITDLQKIKLNK
ncbi:MAG: hypothetical protein WCK02_02015 [Bacteroidota bacterium]